MKEEKERRYFSKKEKMEEKDRSIGKEDESKVRGGEGEEERGEESQKDRKGKKR